MKTMKRDVTVKGVTFPVTFDEKLAEHFLIYGLRIVLERSTAGKGDGMTSAAREAIEGLIARMADGSYTPGSGGGGRAPSVDRIACDVIRGNIRKLGTREQIKAAADLKTISALSALYATVTGGASDDTDRVDEITERARAIAEKRIAARTAEKKKMAVL